MHNRSLLKIGTRGSLLAIAQCSLFKEKLEKISGQKFEIVKIKTEGDLKTDKPLWQLDGKDFFTKELDQALLNDQVDLVVHSYKDLGSIRPQGLELAAITQREFAQDIILFRKNLPLNLSEIKIGTSSPRRIYNLERYLKDFLPFNALAKVTCHHLRGNVNSRIEKCLNGEFDGIALALAGLERLATHESSYQILEDYLKELDFIILPLSVFPTAASQGALAVEIHQNSPKADELRQILKVMECPTTAQCVAAERRVFQEFGGGCHLAVGISCAQPGYIFIRGFHQQNHFDELRIENNTSTTYEPSKVFVGLPPEKLSDKYPIADHLIKKESIKIEQQLNFQNIFVTSDYCFETLANVNQPKNIWVSGVKTWKKLVKQGVWVHGSSDSLGHQEILKFQKSKFNKLLNSERSWCVLTGENNVSAVGKTISCYRHITKKLSLEQLTALKQVEAFYWTSFKQYQIYTSQFPEITCKKHYCGYGKTFDQARAHNIEMIAIPSWKKLLKG